MSDTAVWTAAAMDHARSLYPNRPIRATADEGIEVTVDRDAWRRDRRQSLRLDDALAGMVMFTLQYGGAVVVATPPGDPAGVVAVRVLHPETAARHPWLVRVR